MKASQFEKQISRRRFSEYTINSNDLVPPILSELQTNLREIQNRRYLWSPAIIEINQEISNLAQQIHLLADLQKVGMAGGSAYFIARTKELKARMRQLSLERARD